MRSIFEQFCTELKKYRSWFPMTGGLGWGRLRLSLLWKPVDLHLPPHISGFEIATLEIKSVSATDLSKRAQRSISVVVETENDRCTLTSPGEEVDAGRSTLTLHRTPSRGTVSSFVPEDAAELEWEITRSIRLAVEYRQSCSVLISFVTRSGVFKKKRVVGLAILRLNDCADGEECHRRIPIFETSVTGDAMKAAQKFHQQAKSGEGEGSTPTGRDEPKLIGFVSLGFVVHAGISRAHRKLCKRDLRFRNVYEAWEAAREIHQKQGHPNVSDAQRSRSNKLDHRDEDDESDESDGEDEDGLEGKDGAREGGHGRTGSEVRPLEDEDDEQGFRAERKAHARALHRRVRVCSLSPHSLSSLCLLPSSPISERIECLILDYRV